MKVGLISDTHGELENLREALEQLTSIYKIEKIVHLGDEWEDIEVLKGEKEIEVIVVPGVYAREYADPSIPNRIIREFNGWQILFTHTCNVHANDLPEDPDPQELAATQRVDVVAHGHTHVPSIEEKDYVIWVNPGHLKSKDKKGYSPSYGVLDISPEKIRARIVDLDSKETFSYYTFVKKKVTIRTSSLRLRAVLNDTKTAQKIWEALPIEQKANLWGEEIYFSTPVQEEIEDGEEVVQAGDIGYWPPAQAICLFFGPTPASKGNEIRPYSPVTVVGKIVDDPRDLKGVGEKEVIKLDRLW